MKGSYVRGLKYLVYSAKKMNRERIEGCKGRKSLKGVGMKVADERSGIRGGFAGKRLCEIPITTSHRANSFASKFRGQRESTMRF